MYLMNFYVFFHLGASLYNFHINDCRDPISTLNFHFAHRLPHGKANRALTQLTTLAIEKPPALAEEAFFICLKNSGKMNYLPKQINFISAAVE